MALSNSPTPAAPATYAHNHPESGLPASTTTTSPTSKPMIPNEHSTTTTTTASVNNTNQPSTNNNNNIHNHRSQLPENYAALTASVASFLAVSIHQILFLRSIYPQPTFLPVRHFNHPVRQSRHPKVCTWVSDACAAVQAQLLKCTVSEVSIVILSARTNQPLERYTFDMTQMPRVPLRDVHIPFASSVKDSQQQQQRPQSRSNNNNPPMPNGSQPGSINLEAQFRAVLARLASACARLTPLPPDEEYMPTLHIVLREGADAPAGVTKEEQLWIAAEPEKTNLNNDTGSNAARSYEGSSSLDDSSFDYNHHTRSEKAAVTAAAAGTNNDYAPSGLSRCRAKTVPVRTVDAGEIQLEVWVEEAKGKFEELDRIRSQKS
ncbi:hypothetical protein AJ80_08874 [Polytolypa hystricis UAMH7299]|uniref:HORMA domain-containing protein n=1 Tax=Polytolypa hystricis (strain UAMH7299) TaxID=1447883 RepID=A0A2B7X0V6_POLH7|nr:hypothetical protein AJ80_08874 [Polytolypa hystricis UAMH7299]